MSIKDEIAKIEAAIETIDPAAKATIENATATIKADTDKIADSVATHAAAAKAAIDSALS
jgi:copper chaperone CopZ